MNDLPGKKYPEGYFPEAVIDKPAFLLHLGDITHNGYDVEWYGPDRPDQQSYIQTFEYITVTNRRFEALGNHDSTNPNTIGSRIIAEHGGTYYSFDEQGVHFVILDPYAGTIAWPKQLDWLKEYLDKLRKSTPIIISMHHHPGDLVDLNETSKTSNRASDRLWDIVANRNVIAFLHGHRHTVSYTKWHRFDVLSPAGFAYGWDCSNCQTMFGVIRITDNRFTVFTYDWKKEEFLPTPLFKASLGGRKPTKDLKSSSSRDIGGRKPRKGQKRRSGGDND